MSTKSKRNSYTAVQAWKIAMSPGGSRCVVDIEGGGYAVPVEANREIKPPSKTVPIRARVPGRVVNILPGSFGVWRVVS